MRRIFYHLGQEGRSLKKFFCYTFVVVPFISGVFTAGYGSKSINQWFATPSCFKIEIGDLNPFSYKNPEALTDKELACLISGSNWPKTEWPSVFKQVYCESSKKPHATRHFGGRTHYGLMMMSEYHKQTFGLEDAKIFYVPKFAMYYSHLLWEERGWQPWRTDSRVYECLTEGPDMNGDELRDGWKWAEPTFAVYFRNGPMKIYNEFIASIF